MNAQVLYTRNLSVGYREGNNSKILIKDINVQLRKGQLTCLLGQNGVGKSTLLRTLLNLQPPIGGEILINDQSIEDISLADLSQIVSLVLTDPIQPGNLSVIELVALGRSPYTAWNGLLSDEDWRKVQWAIDATRINYIENKKIRELSDGQLQKVMIARAIAQDGDLIIMDEPTAHLDLNNRVEIMQLLRELTLSTKKSILVATHELQLTLQLADQVWLTNFNTPLVSGAPEDLALNGSLEQTFYHENFEFDIRSGKATVPKLTSKTVTVDGDDDWAYWTKNALERIGYSIKEQAPLAICKTDNHLWQSFLLGKEERIYKSLEDLVEDLTKKDRAPEIRSPRIK